MPGKLRNLAAAAGAAARAAVEQGRGAVELRRHSGGLAARNGLAHAGAIMPSTAVLQAIIAGFGLSSVIDDDGDLTVRRENYSVYFFHFGEDAEVLQARLYLNRRFEVELRPTLALLLDDWNRSKLFPKAYTVLPDDGLVGICAEQAFDFEGGTNPAQLTFTVGIWLHNLEQFAEWVEEHV
ncbi:YbjN domain-containing protein [Jatrophihabitans telluris]|uniref:YbjN domain-containing protein n=1 Tax=Jatrophihabitans telluris TaxID=2038343 RepID=A0ABY4QVW7_9ACTN|nr:YbjN domain-containing protein [Jatrophihabitans telluris]UQX87478.1 YbjN domain-containing protein [Jatrophihabitans telluris]